MKMYGSLVILALVLFGTLTGHVGIGWLVIVSVLVVMYLVITRCRMCGSVLTTTKVYDSDGVRPGMTVSGKFRVCHSRKCGKEVQVGTTWYSNRGML